MILETGDAGVKDDLRQIHTASPQTGEHRARERTSRRRHFRRAFFMGVNVLVRVQRKLLIDIAIRYWPTIMM